MTTHAKVLIAQDGATVDLSQLISRVRWQGRKGCPARSVEFTFIDDDAYKRARSDIDVEKGCRVVFYWKDKELFRGMFVKQKQSERKLMPTKAYDRGISLSNNDDTWCYSGNTASEIFADICRRLGIPTGEIADTRYRIPELPKPDTTAWDALADALSLTYKATGIRYYPLCRGEAMHLIERRLNIYEWAIETGVNIEDYSLEKSIERVRTRIVLKSREGEVLAQAENAELEGRIGVHQRVIRVDDDMNSGQLIELVNTTLEENNQTTQSLPVTVRGITDVITGVGVYVAINPLGITKTYYVEHDVHTFEGNDHSMTVRLVPAMDLNRENNMPVEIRIGDIVNFAGGPHFYRSIDTVPRGGIRRGGPARCTHIALGARQSYHLIGGAFSNSVDGNSNVYGWVDAGLVSR